MCPQVSERALRVEVWLGLERVAALVLPEGRVDDGEWHHVMVELRSVKEGTDIKYLALVALDYGMVLVRTWGQTHPDTHTHPDTDALKSTQPIQCVCVCV